MGSCYKHPAGRTHVALAAALSGFRVRLQVTITAATAAFELAGSCLSDLWLALKRLMPPAARSGVGDSGTAQPLDLQLLQISTRSISILFRNK